MHNIYSLDIVTIVIYPQCRMVMNPLKRMYARMKRGFPVWDGLPYHMCHVLTVADCMINVKRGLINPGPLVIGVVPFK